MKSERHSERGSAAFYILMAIALLGALTYATSKGARFGSKSLTNDQAKLAAQEIIEYGSAVASAVQKLRLRGCMDTQLSFETSYDDNGAVGNPNAPGNESCHVYSPNGGMISHMTARPSFHETGETWFGTWRVSGKDAYMNVGTAEAELTLNYWGLKKEVCEAINQILRYNGPIPVEQDNNFDSFDGTYSSVTIFGDHINGTELSGKTAGCLYQENSGEYDFFQVLIAR